MTTTGLSLQNLLDGLPVATVVFSTQGEVIAATKSFWQICGKHQPFQHLTELGNLGSTLRMITHDGALPEGHCTYLGSEGALYIDWKQIPCDTHCVVACLTRQNQGLTSDAVPLKGELHTAPAKELPNALATLDTLTKTIASCKDQKLTLSIARIRVCTSQDHNLAQTDHEAWRSIGRRLRAACRMSDFVGITGDADYLIILMNANLQTSETVTRRVLTQINSWCKSHLNVGMWFYTGLASWTAEKPTSAEALLQEAELNFKIIKNA